MTLAAPALFNRDAGLIYRLDAGVGLTMFLAFTTLANPLAALVGWPPMEMIFLGAGIFLLPWGLFNWAIGSANGPDRLSIAANILGDGLWVLLSALLLVLYSAQMTPIGVTLILGQALFVAAVFATKLAVLRAENL